MKKFLILFLISFCSAFAARLPGNDEKITVFFTNNDIAGRWASVKGLVLSLGVQEFKEASDINQNVERKSKVTVRLNSSEGVMTGDVLYIIDGRGLVISKLTVKAISRSQTFGNILVGYGNFRRVQQDMRVCSLVTDNDIASAKLYKSKGDYYMSIGDHGNAIANYDKSAASSETYPDSHIALGYIYLGQNITEFAMKEFDEAYKNFSNIYDKQDRFDLLKGMTLARYNLAYESVYSYVSGIGSQSTISFREKYIKEGRTFGLKAAALNPKDSEIWNILGRFYFDCEMPDEKKARDCLVKSADIDPDKEDVYIMLCRLYLKYKNIEMASKYLSEAARVNPGSRQVADLARQIKD